MLPLQPRLAVAAWAIVGAWIASTTGSLQLRADDQQAKAGAGHTRMGGMLGGRAAVPMFLLSLPEIQKELGLSAEQQAKLKELAANYFREIRQQMGGLRELGEQQRIEKLAQVQKKAHAEGRELCKRFDEVLSSYQKQRFKQILLQVRGVTALGDKDVAEALGLTDGQKRGLKAVGDSAREKLAELERQRGDLKRQQAWERARAIQKESTEKALALLTQDQRDRFEKMKGPRLDLDLHGPLYQGMTGGAR